MGVFIYFVLTLFCGYMAFELGRYVIATGDALPIIIVSLLALLSIHCIRQVCKAIKNKRPRYPRLNQRSTWNKVAGGLGFSWWFRGRFGGCVMGHQQTRKNTNKQGKHLSSKGNAFQTREIHFRQGNAFQARGIFRSNVKVCKW